MMDWYIPITILPGIGMLILSTTTQMMALSNEIGLILMDRCDDFEYDISKRKIKQLTRLTTSASLLYISAACFVTSGIAGAFVLETVLEDVPQIILLIGVVMVFFALIILINYGFHTINIRRAQHTNNRRHRVDVK